MSSESASYGKLRKEFLFHEKRLQLLLDTRVSEDLGYNVAEKTEARTSCLSDCTTAMRKFESGAKESALSGRWNELRVCTTFSLEVPCHLVVGSDAFEQPAISVGDVTLLVQDVQEKAKRFTEFQSQDVSADAASAKRFTDMASDLQWTPRDMQRIKDSVTAKLSVLSELDGLAAALHDSQFGMSVEQLKLEELRRTDEDAEGNGEVAVSESTVREKLATLQRIIDILFFQIHTVDSSVDSNLNKRRNNLAVFQNGAAVVDCIRREKQDLSRSCERDLGRISRCMEHEDQHSSRTETSAKILESTEKIRALDRRQEHLTKRLQELFQEFDETEKALQLLSQHRTEAVVDHMDLVQNSRYAISDFNEMCAFAQVHATHLRETRTTYARSVEALDALEKFLLQQKNFETYDFGLTSKRLATMQRRVCIEMNRSLNEYESLAENLLRRLASQAKALDEQIDLNTCQAEVRKEHFDPLTKKYVVKAKELSEERQKIVSNFEKLNEMVQRQRGQCMDKVKEHLSPDEIVDVLQRNNAVTLSRQEDLLDMRQEVIVPPDVGIQEERLRLQRERQSVQVAQLADPTAFRRSKILALRGNVHDNRNSSACIDREQDAVTATAAGTPLLVFQEEKKGTVTETAQGRPSIDYKGNEERNMVYRVKARVIGDTVDVNDGNQMD